MSTLNEVAAGRPGVIKTDDIIVAALSSNARFGQFRSWGMYAEQDDLKKVLERLWMADSPQFLINLLSIFCNRALPEFDADFQPLIPVVIGCSSKVNRRRVDKRKAGCPV